ncbi:hypothetical protein Terro_3007 [Terriglobus roseus DSM 18391]|uniref:Uncharacterized protein n=2 Tax=Terriglobus roseus TaxID=392734 RepID=I3ZJ21_TERRK|nr:hypothetical protein Terro_3007 [Terriglobus roseus DSM 18391]
MLSIRLSAHGQTTASIPPSPMHRIYTEDQADLPDSGGTVSYEQYMQRVTKRMADVRQLLTDGKLTTGRDLRDASLIFQHGNTEADCLFAHVLAMEALLHGDIGAKWAAAATLDRYLQLIGKSQIFGTQYPSDASVPKVTTSPTAERLSGRSQQPYDPRLLPDGVRQDFCVPTVEEQKKNVAVFNTGARPSGTAMRSAGCMN